MKKLIVLVVLVVGHAVAFTGVAAAAPGRCTGAGCRLDAAAPMRIARRASRR